METPTRDKIRVALYAEKEITLDPSNHVDAIYLARLFIIFAFHGEVLNRLNDYCYQFHCSDSDDDSVMDKAGDPKQNGFCYLAAGLMGDMTFEEAALIHSLIRHLY